MDRKLLLLTFIIPFLVYIKTLLPYVDYWDTGEFQTIAYTFDIAHPTGYPTYILLGKLVTTFFKTGSVAHTMNLLSAFLVSLGILFISYTLYKLSKNIVLSVILPILLSFNPYLWAVAIRADPHALHFLFTSIFIFLLVKLKEEKSYKVFVLLNLITGLSIGNHLLSIFFVPVLAFSYFRFFRKKIFLKKLILPSTMFLLGISVYTLLPIISYYKLSLTSDYQPNNIHNFIRYVFGQDFSGSMFNWSKGTFSETFKFYLNLTDKSFPNYVWLMIPFGLIIGIILNPMLNIQLLFIFLTTLYFSMTYQNAVIERYYIPIFTISIIWLSQLLTYFIKMIHRKIITIEIYIIVTITTLFLLFSNYKIIDQSKNFSASKWGVGTLSSLNKDSVIFSWWSYSTPLWYLQKVEGVRNDILIINSNPWQWEDLSKKYINTRPVYFINKIDLKSKNFRLIKNGDIYKLELVRT